MADRPVPFWRRLAEAVGIAEPAGPGTYPASGHGTPAPTAKPGAQAVPAVARTAPPAAGPSAPAAGTAPSGASGSAAEPRSPSDAEALLDLWFARAEDDVIAWRQCVPGPSAAEIGTRLSLIPAAFLSDDVAILALAEHILDAEYGGATTPPAARRAQDVLAVVNQVRETGSAAARRAAALVLWLWASDEVHGPLSVPLTIVLHDRALAALAFRLAAVVDPADWVSDADRRDEAARQFLFWSGHLPAGEDEVTAKSILGMRDSLQQNAALAQTLADHEHWLEVTRRLQQARAREAAARYSNE